VLNVLFVVVFFFVVVILIKFVPILRLLVLFILIIVGDGVYLDRMDLNDFHLRLTLGTRQDFAFFHFIFVDVNFSSAFRTPDHGENLLQNG